MFRYKAFTGLCIFLSRGYMHDSFTGWRRYYKIVIYTFVIMSNAEKNIAVVCYIHVLHILQEKLLKNSDI